LSPVMAKPAPKMIASPLADTTWQLVGGEMLTANSNGQITLRFTQQNLSGSAGCNRYSTGYSVKDNQLKTKAIASTRMACPSPLMEQETAYLRALETAHSFKVNGQGELEIAYGDRAQPRTLRFVKVETQASGLQTPLPEAPSLEGTNWNLILIGTVEPLKEPPATLTFKDQKIAGTGGCNRFMGQFKTEGDQISINSSVALSMMACPAPQMKQEQQVIEALKNATRYRIDGEGQLLIYAGTDETNPALTWAATDEKSRAGRQATLYVGPKTVPCTGVGRMQCWQVREKATDPWRLLYTPIKGFNYEPGYLYELKVREETIPNPPADGSSKQWVLLDVIKKSPWGQL
ncbi:MAG: META domain-containing protein, partial [Microcystaceae cyanobacterium]